MRSRIILILTKILLARIALCEVENSEEDDEETVVFILAVTIIAFLLVPCLVVVTIYKVNKTGSKRKAKVTPAIASKNKDPVSLNHSLK